MARLVDADALIDFIDCGHLRNPAESCFSERDVVNMLEARPTVDAVEVVRCKDCKRYQLDSIFHVGFCDGKRCKDDDFCSYGKRKENT